MDEVELCCQAMQWQVIFTWQQLYSQLMREEIQHEVLPERPTPFDFCLYINIRENDNDAGMGYGMPECRYERCVLRACTLACNGNILFGDWGFPSGWSGPDSSPANYPLERIALRFENQWYCYASRHPQDIDSDFYGHLGPSGKGFAALVRLGHYLRPITSELKELPVEYVDKIHTGSSTR